MTYSDLSPRCQTLLKKMRDLNYGTITNLRVENGEPILTEDTRITSDIALDKKSDPTPLNTNHPLKHHVLNMINQFTRVRDGTISSIRVQEGIPFRMQIDEQL